MRLKNPLKTEQAAREVALGLLARREHSQKELLLKLRSRGCPEDIADAVIAKLVDQGMQSEERFADAFIRSRIDRGSGPARIRVELKARGLEPDFIDNAMEEYNDWWKDLALEVYQKRYASEGAAEDYNERAKRSSFLRRRGFTADQIHYVMNQA